MLIYRRGWTDCCGTQSANQGKTHYDIWLLVEPRLFRIGTNEKSQ